MFTGIIQGTGVVRQTHVSGPDLKLIIDVGKLGDNGINVGDSVAVDGACLTVVDRTGNNCHFDVSHETLQRTLMGSRIEEDQVNLELALLPTTRIGGHFVTGHVDGIGRLETLQKVGLSNKMRFRVPPGLSRFIAEKGSICIDGISLTVNSVLDNMFEVSIVPHTLQVTTMQRYLVGRHVHLEIDIIARYLESLMGVTRKREMEPGEPAPEYDQPGQDGSTNAPDAVEITEDFLSKRGFLAPDTGE